MKKIVNLENYLYLVTFLLPTYLIRFKFLGVPTNFLEILIILAFIIWSVKIKFNFKSIIFDRKYAALISVILACFLVSALINNNLKGGLGIIKGWFLIPILFVVVLCNYLEKAKIANVFKVFFWSSLAVALVSLGYLILEKLTYDFRLEAFFNSPNYLAMYLSPGAIIGLVAINQIDGKKNRKYFISALIIILMALYFTYSYAAWGAIILSLISIVLIKNKRLFLAQKYKLLSILAIMAILVLAQANSQKMDNLRNYSRSSLESRRMIWQSSEKMLKENWLWGIGPGNFQNKYLENQKYFPPYLEWAVPHPHNIFLAFWLYGGIISLIVFLGLVFIWFGDIFKKDNENKIKFIALGIMVYMLIHGLVDTTYFKNDLAIIFWLNFLALKK